MAKKGKFKWTMEQLKEASAPYKTRGEFNKKNKAMYDAAWRQGEEMLDAVCAHMGGCKRRTTENMLADAKGYESLEDMRKSDMPLYKAIARNKLQGEAFEHMEGYKQPEKRTIERAHEEALKYPTKVAFKKGSNAIYEYALRRNWIKDICSHMTGLKLDWTIEEAHLEALKHTSRVDFQRKSLAPYKVSFKRGWLDIVCSHMVEGRGTTDNDVVYIWQDVGEVYGGKPVYKFGITSERLGLNRIERGVQAAGCKEYDLIILQKVKGKATDVEKQLLEIGDNPKYQPFDGSTEFRALSNDQLKEAINLIKSAS